MLIGIVMNAAEINVYLLNSDINVIMKKKAIVQNFEDNQQLKSLFSISYPITSSRKSKTLGAWAMDYWRQCYRYNG